jgi:hypothetical protein
MPFHHNDPRERIVLVGFYVYHARRRRGSFKARKLPFYPLMVGQS